MPRPPASPAPRERMLESALALMRRAGLTGAGINEIVRESAAPKGSVYHFFPGGKRQIVEEALAAYEARVGDFIDGALAGRGGPGARTRALFDAFARRLEAADFGASCAAGAVCLDLDGAGDVEALRPAIERCFAAWRGRIAAHYAFRDRRRARAFAGLVLTAVEGAYVRGRAERSAEPFREAGRWLAQLAEAEPAG